MPASVIAVMAAQSIAAGGGSYTLRDQFSGSSKDTALWDATTRAPGWLGTTIGGSDVEGSGIVTITPTAGAADRLEGRSSVALDLSLSNRAMWLRVTSVPSGAGQSSTGHFGYSHAANRGAQNFRWAIVNNFSTLGIEAHFSNFGGGSSTNLTYDSTDHAWLGFIDEGTDLTWVTAPDSSGAPGTPVVRRRLSVSGGGDGYFSPSSGDVGLWVGANNANACPYSFSEIFITA
jgi:hypothetical protein